MYRYFLFVILSFQSGFTYCQIYGSEFDSFLEIYFDSLNFGPCGKFHFIEHFDSIQSKTLVDSVISIKKDLQFDANTNLIIGSSPTLDAKLDAKIIDSSVLILNSIFSQQFSIFNIFPFSYDLYVFQGEFNNGVTVDFTNIDRFEIVRSTIKDDLTACILGIKNGLLQETKFDKVSLSQLTVLENITLRDSDFKDTLRINGFSINGLNISSSFFIDSSEFMINNGTFDSVAYISNSGFSNGIIMNDVEFRDDFLFRNSVTADLKLNDVQFAKNCDFSGSKLPQAIILNNVSIKEKLDLTTFIYEPEQGLCKLFINNTNVNNLLLDYLYFDLQLASSNSSSENDYIYNTLLKIQKENNFTMGYKKLDIEYRRSKNNFLVDEIMSRWDNYGYDKKRIFGNTLIWFSIFFTLISIYFKFFITQVYCPQGLTGIKNTISNQGNISNVRLYSYAFIYTFIVFFWFRIEIKNFNIRGNTHQVMSWKKVGVVWILLAHIMGIICTAYLANYIITQ